MSKVSDDQKFERYVELALQRWISARTVRTRQIENLAARHAAQRQEAEERARRRNLKCGARTRRGTACIRKALENGKCRNHGGLSTGPTTSEGRARIAAAQRRRWAAWRAERTDPVAKTPRPDAGKAAGA